MTYRDDREADRARIEALDAELGAARRRIEELEGARSRALVPTSANALAVASGAANPPWYGAPLRLELARTFTGEFPREEFEDIIELVRSRTRDAGRAELLKSSLTWSAGANQRSMGPFTVVTISIKNGMTSLIATDALGQLAAGIYGGIGGGVGGGTIVVPLLALMSVPALIPVGLIGWLGGTFLCSRSIFKRASRRRAQALQELFEAVAAHIAARIPRAGEGA